MASSVLIVDDEPCVRTTVAEVLGDAGYTVAQAADGEECLARLAREPADVVLMDIQMPGIDGMETFRRMVKERYRAEVIIISGHGTIETAVEAMRCGALDFLEKPFSASRLRDAVGAAMRKREHRREIEGLREQDWMIGDYVIEREIGAGATATIYKARQRRLDRTVGLKVLHRHLTADASFRERFAREARVLGALEHPNIVRVFDSGEDRGHFFLAMEYLDGSSLGDRLEKNTCLPLSICLLIGVEVCKALEHAHAKGVIHRDIKPQNIIVTPSGSVMIVDFGLAAWLQAASVNLTGPNSIVGTPHFMAPEQIESREAGPAADLFSLGVVLYLLTTLHYPFPGENLPSVLHAIVQGRCQEPRRHNRLMSQVESDTIMQCLRSDPRDRFASAAELRRRLEEIVSAKGIGGGELGRYFGSQISD